MLQIGLTQGGLLIDHQVITISDTFIRSLNVDVCRAATPQSTMSCNHMMSDWVELGVLTVKEKKKGRWTGVLKKQNAEITTNSCNRKGVDAGFNKEFLASAVESGLTAVVSSFTLL